MPSTSRTRNKKHGKERLKNMVKKSINLKRPTEKSKSWPAQSSSKSDDRRDVKTNDDGHGMSLFAISMFPAVSAWTGGASRSLRHVEPV